MSNRICTCEGAKTARDATYFVLKSAPIGGYTIEGGGWVPGDARETLLAGTLEQCLAFMRDRIRKPELDQ